MKKINFDINYKEKIINGSAKVFYNDHPVRIICWDKEGGNRPIVGLMMDYGNSLETIITISENGFVYIPALNVTSGRVYIHILDSVKTFKNANDVERFDFTKLKAFTPVLARNSGNKWSPHFFESFHPNNRWGEFYMIDHPSHQYSQCVPYEGNEHLLSTRDPIPEYYKLER